MFVDFSITVHRYMYYCTALLTCVNSVTVCSSVVDRCTYSAVDILYSLDIRQTHGRQVLRDRTHAAHAHVQLLQLPTYNLKIRLFKIIGLVFEHQRIL